MTLGLVLANVLVFMSNPMDESEVTAAVEKSYKESKLASEIPQAFQTYCVAHGGASDLCEVRAQDVGKNYDEAFVVSKTETPEAKSKTSRSRWRELIESKTDGTFWKIADQYWIYQRIVASFTDVGFSQWIDHADTGAAKQFREQIGSYYEKRGILSPQTFSVWRLLKAQFQHMGWAHIVGNLMLFAMVGVVLEQRLKPLHFLAVYLVGGTLGALSSLAFETHSITSFMGASANITALLGVFTVLFWKFRVKFWLWIAPLPVARSVFVQVSLLMPLMFFLVDFVGLFDSGSGTSHVAHVAGWVTGLLGAFAIQKLDPVAWPFVDRNEALATETLMGMANETADRRASAAHETLRFNRENVLAKSEFVKAAFESQSATYLQEAEDLFPGLLSVLLRVNDEGRALQLLRAIPQNCAWDIYFASTGQSNLERLCEGALARKELGLALRLIDVFTVRFPRSHQSQKWLSELNQSFFGVVPSIDDVNQLRLTNERGFWLSTKTRRFSEAIVRNVDLVTEGESYGLRTAS